MPILHVVLMLCAWSLLGVFVAGVNWMYVIGLFMLTLLIIIAVYRPRV